MIARRGFVGFALCAASFGPAAAQQRLGLSDRRGIAAYQERVLPDLMREVHQAAGFELPVEIDWETVVVGPLIGQGDRFSEPEFFTDIYFRPLIEALKAIGRDQMGRDALRAGLKRVVVGHKPWEEHPLFENGVLSLRWRAWANPADVSHRTRQIVEVLEKGL